jgi:hypothetical protein
VWLRATQVDVLQFASVNVSMSVNGEIESATSFVQTYRRFGGAHIDGTRVDWLFTKPIESLLTTQHLGSLVFLDLGRMNPICVDQARYDESRVDKSRTRQAV